MNREDKFRRNIRYYSIFFFFLAAWDVLTLIMGYFDGDFKIQNFTSDGIDDSAAIGIIAFILIVTLFFALLKVFVGLRGLNEAKGSGSTKGLFPLLVFLLVLEIIALLVLIASAVGGNPDIPELCGSAATVLIIFDFLRCIKGLENRA